MRAPTRLIPLLVLLGFAAPAAAQQIIVNEGEGAKARPLMLPYAFYTESMKLTAGVFFGEFGGIQPQASWFATPFISTNGTTGFYGGIWDYQLPWFERLFIRAYGHFGRWDESRSYTALNPRPPFSLLQAGSNDSLEEDFVDETRFDVWVEAPLRVLLPIGHGRDPENILSKYVMDEGLLVGGATGGESWNPWKSGQTFAVVQTFYQRQSYDVDRGNSRIDTLGFRIGLDHDNRDFRPNPEKGHRLQAYALHDPGWLNRAETWTAWEAQLSKYFLLGRGEHLKQAILAFDVWTSEVTDGDAPYNRGPRLGGYWRLRGFDTDRFNDQAAVAYTLELRLTPRWNPWPRVNLFGLIEDVEIDWFQVVLFGEAGRVADDWDFSELHSDMKWDLGIGLRAMIQKAVFRADVAGSTEGVRFVLQVGHPF